MRLISVRNVHRALPEGVRALLTVGRRDITRNGPALVYPMPVCTHYRCPKERVLFWEQRDANPFFHFFEGLWMLAGRNDVAFLAQFVGQIKQYSDDGVKFWGAYGHRWRSAFNFDQLKAIVVELKKDPRSRRAVLTMWDPPRDLHRTGKDFPCNTHIYFSREEQGVAFPDVLNMTVCCRSNDMVWGAYGANAVHFSMLQEYMAGLIGIDVGHMWQMSNNFHAYPDTFEPLSGLEDEAGSPFHRHPCPYELEDVTPYPMMSSPEGWTDDLLSFMDDQDRPRIYTNPFFTEVVHPLWEAHKAYRDKDSPTRFLDALRAVGGCAASDWRVACYAWLVRRENALKAAEVAQNRKIQT